LFPIFISDWEEAKGTRKRLVGCHFRLRQLKTQYDEIMNHNTKMDITGNEKNPWRVAWNPKLIDKDAELITVYCNDVVHLASERVEAM
jgi:phenolic acid decarboxylase